MCIAIASPKGVDLPPDNILHNCFINNPDGGGFAYNLHGNVIIKKGYMKWDDFINAIHEADKKYNLKNRGVLIHTRITTHGGTRPEMTHPFPIVADEGALSKTEYCSPYGVIHNGIISLTSADAYKAKTMSDTAVFISEYLTKIATNKDWFYNKSNIELIEALIGSKMALLNGAGDIMMTSGFTADNGIFYSNSSYKDGYTKALKPYKPYSYSGYYNDCYNNDSYYYSDYNYSSYSSYDNAKKNENGGTKSTPVVDPSMRVISLMRLKEGEVLCFDDGTDEYYSDDYDLYLTEENEVYYSDKDETTTYPIFLNKTKFDYLGTGCIISEKSLNPVNYRKDHYTYKKYLESDATD